jgi:hypothetical protein
LEFAGVVDGPETAFQIAADGEVSVHPGANFPAWLRSRRQYENFELRGEFFLKGWMDSGIYLHAPEHGRPAWCGMEIKIFHQQEDPPTPYSCGSVFPVVAPKLVRVKNKGEWNPFEIRMDWPRLVVRMNGEVVQDLDVESVGELRDRLRKGYIGLESLSYPIRYRKLAIRELPAKQKWELLYTGPADAGRWQVSEGKPVMEALGPVLRLSGLGHVRTEKQYKDFRLESYVRTSRWHNGGVVFRSAGGGTRSARSYEMQLHNVEGAHYPTGSLYHHKRATYPRIADEQWWLLQMIVQGRRCVVRINGENVLEFDELTNAEAGYLELQAHAEGTWAEFKGLKISEIG